jgi:hypothetical protein
MKRKNKFVIFVAVSVLLIAVIYGPARSAVAVADRICASEGSYCISIGDTGKLTGWECIKTNNGTEKCHHIGMPQADLKALYNEITHSNTNTTGGGNNTNVTGLGVKNGITTIGNSTSTNANITSK